MFLLAVESSTKFLSCALFKDGTLLEEITSPPDDKTHSEKILPLIDSLMTKHTVPLGRELGLAVSAGPGSFTSLRVGLATCLGLNRGAGCPIFPVSSLKALALSFPNAFSPSLVAPLLKAGRGRIYGALFENKKNRLELLLDEASYLPSDFISRVKSTKKLVSLGGPGVELIQLDPKEQSLKLIPDLIPQARFVGQLVLMEKSGSLPPEKISLRYLQEPDLG